MSDEFLSQIGLPASLQDPELLKAYFKAQEQLHKEEEKYSNKNIFKEIKKVETQVKHLEERLDILEGKLDHIYEFISFKLIN